MQGLKTFFCRKNLGFMLLAAVQLAVLLARFGADFGAGSPIEVTPDLLEPYAGQAVREEQGVRVEDFVGQFAVSNDLNIEAGSYRVLVSYANDGGTGSVHFWDERMPAARYDVAALTPGASQASFALWMEHGCDNAQMQFNADCAEGQSILITGVRLIPTHAFAYVHFLTLLALFAAADWVLLVVTGRLALPWRTLKARYSALGLVCLVLIACLPLGLDYLVYGHDLTVHLSRIEGLKAGLLAGQFPVRMYPDLLSGKGYPFGVMYADLLLYPAAVLRILGFPLQTAYKLYVFGITLATALVTRYALRRMLSSETAALAGTALYLLAPYRLTNVYVRGAVGEYSSMLFLPLVVYGMWRICRQRPGDRAEPWCWAPLALGFTGLLQTHLLTTVMAGFVAAVFCLVNGARVFRRPVLPCLCKAAGAALVWNLWFLTPLLHYMITGACRVSARYDAFYLWQSALMPGQLFMPFGAGGGSSLAPAQGLNGEMFLSAGLAMGLGIGLFVLAMADPAVRRAGRGARRLGAWTLGMGALCLWMASDRFPWYDLSVSDNPLCLALSGLFGKLQYAWRMLSPAAALLAVCTACAVALFAAARPQTAQRAAALLALLAVIPAGYLMYDVCTDSPVTYYMSLGATGVARRVREDQIAEGEYLPADLPEETALQTADVNLYFDDGVEVREAALGTLSVRFTAQNTTGETADVILPLYAYPGYKLSDTASGAALDRRDGYLVVTLPAGWDGTATVEFAGFWFWRAADLASLAGIAVMALCYRRSRRGRAPKATS